MHWSSLALLSLLQRKFCYNSVKKFYMNVNGENILLSDIFPLTPVWCCEMIPILTTCNPLCVACRNVSSSFPSSYSVVFPQSIFYFCLSPLLFSASSFLNILANCSSLVALSFLLPPFSCSHVYLLPPFLVSSSSSTPSLIFTFPSPLSSLLFLLHHLLSSFLFIIFLSPLVVTGEQLALLQYRLSMSSMPCQPHAPPGSGTLHTYQVLLPFHSPPPLWGLLEVNLNQ